MAKNELSRLRGLLLADVKAREQILDILNKLEEMDLNNTEYIEEISTKLLALNKFSTKEEYEATNNELNNLLLQINELSEINGLIPNTATSENKLVDKNFLNSSIATATAEFRGTFENLDTLKSSSADINDYAFYKHTDESGNTVFDRYKFTDKWEYEYTLNNSSFTAEQWATINSGLTAKALDDLVANTERELEKKVNYTDIVDALNSEETSKPLSAKMGKELKTQVDTKAELEYVNEELNKKASNNQVDEKISGVKGYIDETLTNYPTNNQIDATLENYAKKDGYYETFGYAREAGVAKNLQSDKDKLLDPDVTTSSGTVYADQPFTQRATAMTMKAYLDNELITVGSGYEQWKKEQAFSIVRNNQAPHKNGGTNGITATYDTSTRIFTLSGTATTDYTNLSEFPTSFYEHKILMVFQLISNPNNVSKIEYAYFNQSTNFIKTNGVIGTYGVISSPSSSMQRGQGIRSFSVGTDLTGIQFRIIQIDLTQWFASRPAIAEALNGDEGVKWFLQNYPQALTLDYDEGTIVDTEDYDYETTGVNLWDEEWEVGSFDNEGEPIQQSTIRSKNFIKIIGNTSYYFYSGNNNWFVIFFYDSEKRFISSVERKNNTALTPENAVYMKFRMDTSYGTTYKNDIQICNHFTETSVEQTYHKYETFKKKVSWAFTSTGKGKSAGSILGSITDTKDYVNKKNIEKVGQYIFTGNEKWTIGTQYAYLVGIPSNGKKSGKILTNCNIPATFTSVSLDPNHGQFIVTYLTENQPTLEELYSIFSNGKILNYELATPIETDMTGDELDASIPENDYGVERKVPVSGNMFSGSATTILYQDIVWKQIYNNKSLIDNLRVDVDTLESRIPGAAENAVSTHNTSSTAHSDIRTLVSNAQTAANNAQTKANSAYTLAEGRARAVSFDTVEAMTSALKAAAKTDYKIGDNLFIKATGVPDYWVSNVLSTNSGTYGYFEVSLLETQKVDLTNYYTKTESDLKFLSKEEAQNTYATISSVDELSSIINSNRETINSVQSEINVMKESLVNVKSNVEEAKNKAQEAYNLALEIDGSPNGVYANLSALQTAFPSGASGVYLTSDNGHWYYWNGTAWTDGGIYQSSEDIEKIKEDLTQFKNGTFDIESHTSTNLLDPSKVTKGYFYWTNGENENASYNHTDFIPVESGDVLSFQWGNKDSALGREIYAMKFVVGLDADKNIVASSCLRDQTTYTVPIGIKFVVISTVMDLTSVADDNAMSVVKSSVVIDWESYDNSYEKYTLKDSASNDNHINSLIDTKINRSVSKHTIIGDSDSLASDTVIKLSDHLDVKKNKIYRFYGKFTTFNSVTIGHGYNVYGGSWVTIDNTNITAYYYNGSSAIQMGQWSHGLTISDFIDVIINVGDVQNLRASVTVMSVGGDFSQTNIPMGGCNGQIFAFGTQAMTDVKYSVSLNDMTSDVWLFGDSYTSLGDPNKWTYQLMQYGYKGLLMCGFSGASSNNEILAFRELTEIGKPKYIIWALGMNDADTNGSVNTDWKSAYDEVKTWCNNNSVELIACTIPNTPRVRNVEKNNIVRSSGLRYVDFAKAVNAEEDGATWYPNMLSSDNVHPIELGAKVLANRFLVDVPEVIN